MKENTLTYIQRTIGSQKVIEISEALNKDIGYLWTTDFASKVGGYKIEKCGIVTSKKNSNSKIEEINSALNSLDIEKSADDLIVIHSAVVITREKLSNLCGFIKNKEKLSTFPNDTAFFIKSPRILEDLKKLHIPKKRNSYVIEKTIEISKNNYDNFITDFSVDRWFIEINKNLCFIDKSSVWHCILVKQTGKNEGVLIQSDGCDFAKYAAFSNGH